MQPTILLLPGLFNSGPQHWQTLWEARLPNARRVRQADWDAPHRADWVAALDAAIRAATGPVLLAAHSLGCVTAAWWAIQHGMEPHAAKVEGALLAALPDVERADFPACASGFAPMPREKLPFAAIVLASSDDPWCELPRARSWARDWGAQFHDVGPRGHLNADSGLGDWPDALDLLDELTRNG